MPAHNAPVPEGRPTFAGFPRCSELEALDADVAIAGVPYGVPYGMEGSRSPSSEAPAAIREASLRFGKYLTHHDIDFDGPLFGDRDVRIVDCGDVAMEPGRYEENSGATTAVIRTLLKRGALPIVLGGDHSIPIPVMRAYEGTGSMCLIQIDAHLDYRDEVDGVREGLSSSIRRASELPWVGDIVQIGLRGVGSARVDDVADARNRGNVLIPASELHRGGVSAALTRIPGADRYYITVDMDGMDPSIAPGVNSPAFGGLTYFQAFDLIRGLAAKGRVVGFDMVEIAPRLDTRGLTSMLAARLILNLIGAVARAGQFG